MLENTAVEELQLARKRTCGTKAGAQAFSWMVVPTNAICTRTHGVVHSLQSAKSAAGSMVNWAQHARERNYATADQRMSVANAASFTH